MKKKEEQKGLRYPLCKGAYCACQDRDCIYYEFIHYKTRLCLAERKIAELEKAVKANEEILRTLLKVDTDE